ncbi:MAG: hypothetical protein ACK4Z7_10840 [Novosphingobium sp.]
MGESRCTIVSLRLRSPAQFRKLTIFGNRILTLSSLQLCATFNGAAAADVIQVRQNLQFQAHFSWLCGNFFKSGGASAKTCAAQKGLAAQFFLVYCSVYELIFTARINLR